MYAYNPRVEQHERSRVWLEGVLSGSQIVRFAWMTLWAFVRISTNPRAFDRPLSAAAAEVAVSSWLAQDTVGILEPGERYWDILRVLMKEGPVSGPLGMDAALAAVVIEHGATLHTTDHDFTRFPGLKWTNPLAQR